MKIDPIFVRRIIGNLAKRKNKQTFRSSSCITIVCRLHGSVIEFQKIIALSHWKFVCWVVHWSKTTNLQSKATQIASTSTTDMKSCPFSKLRLLSDTNAKQKTEARGLRMSLKSILLWNSRSSLCHWSVNRKFKSLQKHFNSTFLRTEEQIFVPFLLEVVNHIQVKNVA